MFYISANSKEGKSYFGKLLRRLQAVFYMHPLSFINCWKTKMIFKGSDRLCMVVELSMQYCGQIL